MTSWVEEQLIAETLGGKDMNEMTLAGLLRSFDSPFVKEDATHVIVVVEVKGSQPEIIINPKANFAAKREYFKNAYADDLTLKVNSDIKIVGYNFVEDLRDFFN